MYDFAGGAVLSANLVWLLIVPVVAVMSLAKSYESAVTIPVEVCAAWAISKETVSPDPQSGHLALVTRLDEAIELVRTALAATRSETYTEALHA